MVLISGKVIIFPAALDCAASFAPIGSAAKTRILGFIDLAANATPEIKPPPAEISINFVQNRASLNKDDNHAGPEFLTSERYQTNHLLEL